MKDKEQLEYVGICHEIECLGALWAPKNSQTGEGAMFIPEFGKPMDTSRVIKAMRGIIAAQEKERTK